MKRLLLLAPLLTLALFALPSAARATGSCPNEAARSEQLHGLSLPDCRAYEQVTPVDKGDVDAEGFPGDVGASPNGERVRYFSITPFAGDCLPPGGQAMYMSSRAITGEGAAWSTEDVLPCESPKTSVRGFSEDLSQAVVCSEGATPEGAPLAPGVRGYYVRSTATGAYRLLGLVKTTIPEVTFVQARFSADDSHLIFESVEQLLPAATANVLNVYEVDLDTAPAEP